MKDDIVPRRCFGPEIWLAGVAMHLALLAGLKYAPSAISASGEPMEFQRIMYFHVPSAWVAFLAFFVTFVASIAVLVKRSMWWDSIATASAEIGILFCTMALISGSIWGKAAWNLWWAWDPRLTTTFILWLVYASYVILRMSTPSGERSARFGAVYATIGFVSVPLTYVSVKLGAGMHPKSAGLEPKMLHALLFCIGAFTVLYFAFLRARFRVEQLRRAIQ